MKYYCIGIKGTGMSTLAQILSDLGNQVSGYDDATGHKFTQEGLESRNIEIYYDHDHSIDPDTIVTYSVAVPENHPELVRVKNLGLKIVKYSELMGNLISQFKSIGVSGTHGKTTTASLIKHILDKVYGCNYFVGAGSGYASLNNDYFVVESDEFNKHFLDYHPTYSVITNIEAEHLECYKDIDDIRNSFEVFANQTSDFVIANGDNEEVRKINFKTKVIYFGFGFKNDVMIKNVKTTDDGSRFDLYLGDDLYGSFEVPLYGKHMVYDTCAAIIMCKELGVSKEDIYTNLRTFKNAKRRFAISRIRDTIIIDDYAHHPTEIKATIDAARLKYPDKRLVVIFKPNTYSRTKDFKDEFIKVLSEADKVFLTEIESNREKPEDYPGVSSQMIVDGIEGAEIISEDTISKLEKELNSVICFVSCAYVDSLINSLKKYIINTDERGN